MFKIEVNVSGTTYGHYWMNKHADDFLRFLPEQFTREYGQVITSAEITAYKIDEASKHLLEGKISKHEKNHLDMSEAGKIKVMRTDSAKYSADEFVKLADFNAAKLERETDISGATVTALSTVQHDFGDGAEDAVQIPSGHELTQSASTLELELTGTALSQWPYDEQDNFLGNN